MIVFCLFVFIKFMTISLSSYNFIFSFHFISFRCFFFFRSLLFILLICHFGVGFYMNDGCLYVCLTVCLSVCICMNACMYVCLCVRVYVGVLLCEYAYPCTDLRISTCVRRIYLLFLRQNVFIQVPILKPLQMIVCVCTIVVYN